MKLNFLALEGHDLLVSSIPNSGSAAPCICSLGNAVLLLESKEVQPGTYYLPAVI